MKRILRLIIPLALISTVGLVMLSGCNGEDERQVSGTGTVKRIELEGGFYGIVSDDNKNYDPINLSQSFQTDGLRVRFKAKIREDLATPTCGAL